MPEAWWKRAVVYQIYPRSFADTDGDGVGDLEGIRRHLDHLEWLGVDAIWLSPIFPSPMADFGYDVSDYCDIDPRFGTLHDFDRLLDDAHRRGIRVLLDWVPNHTSDRHPWFVESRSSRANPKRDWYLWRDPGPGGGPPNNWRAAFTGESAWTLDEATGQYYLHLFLPQQPDLNWRNPEVVAAMHGTLRFWLDRGVDGFRIDVIHGIVKRPGLPSLTDDELGPYSTARFDVDGTLDVIRGLRRLLDSYPGDRVMVGETYILSTSHVARYYGLGDCLHLAFNFVPLYAPWDAARWHRRIQRVIDELEPIAAWPTWVLSNHDNPRHRTRYGGSEARARAAAVLLLTMKGTPFMYMGEELGLEDARIPVRRRVDPGGRDGCRAPIPWDRSRGHGWPAEPWLPFPPHASLRNARVLRADGSSILHLYRRLLAARRASPALMVGGVELLAPLPGVVMWRRHHEDDVRLVAVNFSAEERTIPFEGRWTVEVASDGAGQADRFAGTLRPEQAVVLRPS
ncbi:MAG TPA: alpha-amylase family glycosyl hydrolase [Longimicrobiales bacterium]|nr:alpha-amylase family glycosyl hydrolase [Longimicrobiales bacterium]